MLETWAREWDINPRALQDLLTRIGICDTSVPVIDGMTEAAVQSQERLRQTQAGNRVFRNNVGCLETKNGGRVRFGLANDTPAMNRNLKSSDIVGIEPVTITPEHVGTIIGRFLSLEVKHGNWKYTGTGREPAQLNWINLINSLGGNARFVNGA